MSRKQNADNLTVTKLIEKLSDLAEMKPDADVCFVMAGDGPNDGWPIFDAGMIFDSSSARVLLINDDEVVRWATR